MRSPNSYTAKNLPGAIYVWLVPSEDVLEQPGSWRIRKWDIEPFPEANFTMRPDGPSEQQYRELWLAAGALLTNNVRQTYDKLYAAWRASPPPNDPHATSQPVTGEGQ